MKKEPQEKCSQCDRPATMTAKIWMRTCQGSVVQREKPFCSEQHAHEYQMGCEG